MPTDPPSDQTAEAYATSALAFIEQELPGIDTLSAMLNQRTHPDGSLYDVMDIGWRITPSLVGTFADAAPGGDAVRSATNVYFTTFYSHPDASRDWPTIALHEIVVKASKVLSIYAGLGAVHKLPDPNVPTAILNAAPRVVAAGEPVILTWETTDAIEVTIEPVPGPVALTGVTEVVLEQSTTFVLRARGWTDTVTDTVQVGVSG